MKICGKVSIIVKANNTFFSVWHFMEVLLTLLHGLLESLKFLLLLPIKLKHQDIEEY